MNHDAMHRDPHLGTGTYDPKAYWSAHARAGGTAEFSGVCVFGASDDENRCADRVQTKELERAFNTIGVVGRDVLEYGCGVGRWAPRLDRLGARWHGVDLSQDMCDEARRRRPEADVRALENGRIPHPDASFDVVYAVTVLHHNPHADQERIADEIVRVLRPGGHVVLLEDLGEVGAFNMFPRTTRGWCNLIERRGFTTVSTRGLRYWVLRGALAAVRRRLVTGSAPAATPQSGASSSVPLRRGMVRRVVDRVDALIDPALQGFLPRRAQTAAVMTFSRLA